MIEQDYCDEHGIYKAEQDDERDLPAHKRQGYAERMYESADDRRKELRENAL